MGGKTLIKVDAGLDYALIELEPNNSGNHAHQSYGYFELENRLPVVGEKIYIPQHAGGRMKQLGIVDTFQSDNLCKVLSINQNGCTSSQNVDNQVMMNLGSTGVTLSANTEYSFDPVCLPPQSYTFVITDSYGDGICCSYGEGFYKYTVDLTSISHEGGEFDANEETEFVVNSSPTSPPVTNPTSPPVTTPTSPPVTNPTSPPGTCNTELLKMILWIDSKSNETAYELKKKS